MEHEAPRTGAACPVWDDEKIARLKELWNTGLDARQVAEAVGVSRNAAIGKANRLGLAVPTKSSISRRARIAQREENARAEAESLKVSGGRPCGAAAATAALQRSQCRWPIGHPSEPTFHYCGRLIRPGRVPYCDKHLALSVAPPGITAREQGRAVTLAQKAASA